MKYFSILQIVMHFCSNKCSFGEEKTSAVYTLKNHLQNIPVWSLSWSLHPSWTFQCNTLPEAHCDKNSRFWTWNKYKRNTLIYIYNINTAQQNPTDTHTKNTLRCWPGGHYDHVSREMLPIGHLDYVSHCHLVGRCSIATTWGGREWE